MAALRGNMKTMYDAIVIHAESYATPKIGKSVAAMNARALFRLLWP